MIVLASTSPFRKKQMDRLGIAYACEPPLVDEDEHKAKALTGPQLVEELSLLKARSLVARYPDAVIIGSDQILYFKEKIFGKPHTFDRAVEDLMSFQGQWHELLTGLAVIKGADEKFILNRTRMKMRSLTRVEIERYVQQDSPLQCAGSYKFESLGVSLFEKVETDDPSAIEGLPMIALCNVLRAHGAKLP